MTNVSSYELKVYIILAAIFISIMTFLVILLILAIVSKHKTTLELQNLQARMNQLSCVYEEVGIIQQLSNYTQDDMDKNVAYEI